MTNEPTTFDPELAAHLEDSRKDAVLELARLGNAFHHQTTFIHFLLSCGRRDDPLMEAAQAEQYALSVRISELKESMDDATAASVHMDRLTPAHVPVKRLTLVKESI